MHAQEQVQYMLKMVEWSVERMGGQYCIMFFLGFGLQVITFM